jgi:hypothetical protein
MSVADIKSEPLDQKWIDAMTLRWKASDRYLSGLETESLPEEHAIRILVKHDVSMLLKELARLRPELSLSSSPQFTLPEITA